jgi:hypothetical protein
MIIMSYSTRSTNGDGRRARGGGRSANQYADLDVTSYTRGHDLDDANRAPATAGIVTTCQLLVIIIGSAVGIIATSNGTPLGIGLAVAAAGAAGIGLLERLGDGDRGMKV